MGRNETIEAPPGFDTEIEAPPGFDIEISEPEPVKGPPGFFDMGEPPTELSNVYKVADTMPDPPTEKKKIENSLILAQVTNQKPSTVYDNHDEFLKQMQDIDKQTPNIGPVEAIFKSFVQSLAAKPAMILRGKTAWSPGEGIPVFNPFAMRVEKSDKALLDAANYLESLRNPKAKEEVQKALNYPLWPVHPGDKWTDIDPKMIPKVITAWAAQVGDQIPIMLITQGSRATNKIIGSLVGTAVGEGIATPAIAKAVSKTIEIVGTAKPLIELEAGNFLDSIAPYEIDADIAEKYTRLYSLGAGTIEYSQQMFMLAPFNKMGTAVKKKIIGRVLTEIGGNAIEGLEEYTQQALQNFFTNKAIDEMKEKHPDFKAEHVAITAGAGQSFLAAAGVSAITRGFGHISGTIYNKFSADEKKQVDIAGVKPIAMAQKEAAKSYIEQTAPLKTPLEPTVPSEQAVSEEKETAPEEIKSEEITKERKKLESTLTIRQILEEEISEKKAIRKVYYAGKKTGIEQQKIHEKEKEIRARARKEIRTRINEINKDFKKINIEKMAPQYAEPIKQIIENVDLVKHQKKTILKLEKMRNYLTDNPEAELPDYVMEKMKILDKRNLNDLTPEDLESIHMSVMHYAHLNKTLNEIKIRREKKRTVEVLKDSISEMRPVKKIKENIISSQKNIFSGIKETGQLIKHTFGIRHNHYDLNIELLAGPNSTMDKILYQEVKQGITKQREYRQGVYKKFQKNLESAEFKVKNIDNWLNERIKIGKFNFTRNERMSLYRHSLNEDNRSAITDPKGGFGFRYGKDKNHIYKMTEDELNEIIKSLTDEERQFSQIPVNVLFENQSEAMKKVFYTKNGYPMPLEDNYYPKDTMPAGRATDIDIETESALEKFKDRWTRIGLEKGMLEKRKRVNLPIYLNGLTYDINKSVMRAAAYIGLEMPLSNASKLLYNPTFKNEMIKRYDTITWKEIEQGLRDIAGEWKSYTTVEKLALKTKNKLTTAFLGLNPWVMLKQPLSYAVYSPYVKLKYLTLGMIDYITHSKEILNRHYTYSSEFVEREEGGFSRDVADVFKRGTERKLYEGKKTIQEVMMGGIKWFDKDTVAPGMQGAVLQVLDEFKARKLSREVKIALDIKDSEINDLTPEKKMKLAYKYADYATQRSQPTFAKEHQSSLQRGTPLEQLTTQFGSFTNQALNLIRRTYADTKRTKDPATYKKLAWVIFSLGVVNPLGVMGINELRNRIYGRDDDDSYFLKYINTIAGYMFYIRDLASSIISKIERGTFLGYDVTIPILRPVNLLVNVIANGIRAITDTSRKKREKDAMKCIDESLELLLMSQGLPYGTPKKLIKATIENIGNAL